jgi:CubicO group peptidase (beta-lactamase class C family)
VEIQNHIFGPLGMTESYLSSCKLITIDSINGIWTTASGYANSQDYTRYFSTNGGNRGLISKSYEVAKFNRLLFKDQLLPTNLMDSVRTIIPGSEIQQGSFSCATDIRGYAGYNTDIIRNIDVEGDTAWLYGTGGFGMNGHMTMLWPEKDWTFSFVQNDRSRQLDQRNLAVDLYCYLKDIDSVSYTTLGTATLNSKSDLSIYPNPCVDFLNIDLPNSELIKSYRIIDSRGSMISAGTNINSNRIKTSYLKPGLYSAIIASDESLYNVKFLKVK